MGFLRRLLGGGRGSDANAGEDGDAAVIAQLRAAGADLSASRPVDFFLYFPAETAALAAADRLIDATREIAVKPAAIGSTWLVEVVETMVVDLEAMHARRNEFEGIAREFGGEYDGWGAPA
jgi:hypothetical protein